MRRVLFPAFVLVMILTGCVTKEEGGVQIVRAPVTTTTYPHVILQIMPHDALEVRS